jgi:indolepyruvate ferredoxin oxidoreductase
LLRAIELNGVAVEANKKSFLWGRRAVVDLKKVAGIAFPAKPVVVQMPETLDGLIRRRVEFLTKYQDKAYAASYEQLVSTVRKAEAALGTGEKLSRAVAKSYFKLMAYKDEYEVARLYTNGEFIDKLKQQFDGNFTLKFNLAPPLLAKKDANGHPVKAAYGAWIWQGFRMLAKLKTLRGTWLDVFGYTDERKTERQLIAEYQATILWLLEKLTPQNMPAAIEIASLPESIRGFGHVKEKSILNYRQKA